MNASDKTVAVLNFLFFGRQTCICFLEDFFHTPFNIKMFALSEFFTHSFSFSV